MSYEDTLRSLKVKNNLYVGGTLTAVGGVAPGPGSITATELASDAVITVKVLNANITKAKLETALQPSHVVKYAGTFNTLGGDVTESISVPGALGTDIVMVSVKTAGASPASIVAATGASNAITVTMSVDPSTDHVLQYLVLRAA
jgi:hypothetical protein